MSLVLLATSRTMRAPMFSYLSSRSISLATVTPSLVTVGEPKLFWRMTLRPLGPRVTLTARASLETPRRIASRASWSNAICLAAIVYRASVGKLRALLLDHRQDVLGVHQQDVVAARLLELVAGPVGEQHRVALLDRRRLAA